MSKGKIIVIDGLDGCGKSTQLDIIAGKLREMEIKVKKISFPDYESQSSALVKMYLAGEFSNNPDDVNAYAASSFYAVDRYASYMKYWKDEYLAGTYIITARYVGSNAVHQMSKLEKSEYDGFLEWLFDYEHEKLGLPHADATIFLDMPIDISQTLLSKRYENDVSKKDIHEAHTDYLEKCHSSAMYAARKLNWEVIECSDGKSPLSPEAISEKIMMKISKVI